jgi:hypothetical protein
MDNTLEKRMYSFVMYQLSGIQAGIQAGHATQEYENQYGEDDDFKNWATKWKTVIILNGGTSNSGKESFYGYEPNKGSMERHLETMLNQGIKVVPFYEPDLNYCLSAMSFIVDERVFNRTKYPDFDFEDHSLFPVKRLDHLEILQQNNFFEDGFHGSKDAFVKWLESIGGEKNFFLRLFLKNFDLARN